MTSSWYKILPLRPLHSCFIFDIGSELLLGALRSRWIASHPGFLPQIHNSLSQFNSWISLLIKLNSQLLLSLRNRLLLSLLSISSFSPALSSWGVTCKRIFYVITPLFNDFLSVLLFKSPSSFRFSLWLWFSFSITGCSSSVGVSSSIGVPSLITGVFIILKYLFSYLFSFLSHW